ncbi:hypothetical protein ACOMHN_063955 [Nucella lapillus]
MPRKRPVTRSRGSVGVSTQTTHTPGEGQRPRPVRKHWAFLIRAVRSKLRLSNLVATAAQSQQFFEGLGKMRERAAEENKDKDPVPIFNKRLFASHGSVVITPEARRLMAKNGRTRPGQDFALMTKTELQTMRCVVDGLRLIHRGQDHVKDALSHVVTFESYSPYQYIVKRPFEAQLSCYYVQHGAVQVTYDMDITETRNVFQPDVIYNHGTGEFLGLVSPDGLSDDLSPPATVYTTEPSDFLRIDRQKFHAVVQRIWDQQREEKLSFLSKPANALASLPPDALEKVIPHVEKMDYPPNRTILRQADSSAYLYFILSGRCQLSRDVYIPEIEREVCFYLDAREHDDFFAEECILEEGEGSMCHVTTTSHTSCFLIHRAALEVVSKELLLHVLQHRRHCFPPDEELRERGYRKSVWDGYKHHVVSQSLRERGCMYILSRDTPEKVRSRPPSAESQQRENLLRFMANGAQYYHQTPRLTARVQSARVRTSPATSSAASRLPSRPRTAQESVHPDPTRASTPNDEAEVPEGRGVVSSALPATSLLSEGDGGGRKEENGDEGDAGDDVKDKKNDVITASDDALGGVAVTTSFVRMLEKNLPKGVLQKIVGCRGSEMDPRLMGRAMEENPELGRQLRLAWELHQQEKNDGFTKTTVLVTMKTDDIVRKAKALAEKQTFTPTDQEDTDDQWNSSLHRENKAARVSIAGDKFRAAFLRRKIKGLQTKRAKERASRVYRTATPGHVAVSFSELGQGAGACAKRLSIPERFYLDDIQSKYQGLDPEAASKKVNCMGYQVLFVSRLRRRCRSMHDIHHVPTAPHSSPRRDSQSEAGSTEALSLCSAPELNCSPTSQSEETQEAPSLRRRSAAEVTSRLTCHESIRKDAPVTLRSLTLPPSNNSRADDAMLSLCFRELMVSRFPFQRNIICTPVFRKTIVKGRYSFRGHHCRTKTTSVPKATTQQIAWNSLLGGTGWRNLTS